MKIDCETMIVGLERRKVPQKKIADFVKAVEAAFCFFASSLLAAKCKIEYLSRKTMTCSGASFRTGLKKLNLAANQWILKKHYTKNMQSYLKRANG